MKQDNHFTIADGPPFANGLPHFGHLMISSVKDAYLRFHESTGKTVFHKIGWDCHGFPVENEVEKSLGITSKKDLASVGVMAFNKACEQSIFKYKAQWENTLKKLNRKVDFKDNYTTASNEYMESVWWAFKQLWNKNLVYKTYKPTFYSTKLQSVVSNFEAQQNYKDVKEESVYVKFKVSDNLYALVWTTTPWTLPANQALAFNPKLSYSIVKYNGENYFVATNLVEKLFDKCEVVETFSGEYFLNKTYKPMFDYFKKCTRLFISADFVTDSVGTGIVHLAGGFGEDDFNALSGNVIVHITEDGHFKSEVTDFAGQFVFDNKVVQYLKDNNILFKSETIEHSVPFCWRTETQLIRYPAESYCVKVTDYKDRMVELNQQVNWQPSHIKDGRFGKWLEDCRDWNVSRDRLWGCQIPIWENEDGDQMCFGSFEELKQFVNKEPYDGEKVNYHKPYIDELTFYHPDKPKEDRYLMKPVKYVFDCWVESGCMPFAQFHYPFENQEEFKKNFPAGFIVEAIDQTRGWFYSLLAVSTMLFDTAPYKSVMVTGHINDADGNKLSKKNKNYVPVETMLDTYGSDALRMAFYSSSVYSGEGMKFSEDVVKSAKSNFVIPIENILNFYSLYKDSQNESDENLFDKILIESSKRYSNLIRESFVNLEVQKASGYIYEFVNFISNFYIRNNRERFADLDKNAINSLKEALSILGVVIYPFMPDLSSKVKNAVGV